MCADVCVRTRTQKSMQTLKNIRSRCMRPLQQLLRNQEYSRRVTGHERYPRNSIYSVEPTPTGSHITTQFPLLALLRPARGPPSSSSACTSAASLNLLLLLLAPAPPAPASSLALM